MRVTFYAHASFRLESDGLSVVTDPYTPGPDGSNFDPIDEPADLVIMSSATDAFHSDSSHVSGDPTVVNALELPPEGKEVLGLHIRPFPAMESMTFDFGRDTTECGTVKYLHAQEADELGPYICDLDYVYTKALGYGVQRTKTLAWGCDRCDFRYSKQGVTSAPWPPEFAERTCGEPETE